MKYLGSIFRHLLTLLGGFLVGKGITDTDTANQFIGASYEILLGVLSYLTGQVLSFKVQKEG